MSWKDFRTSSAKSVRLNDVFRNIGRSGKGLDAFGGLLGSSP